jgi:hypothetical protein
MGAYAYACACACASAFDVDVDVEVGVDVDVDVGVVSARTPRVLVMVVVGDEVGDVVVVAIAAWASSCRDEYAKHRVNTPAL